MTRTRKIIMIIFHHNQEGYICQDGKCVPAGECDDMRPCDGVDGICDVPLPYENCEYCDMSDHLCKPGNTLQKFTYIKDISSIKDVTVMLIAPMK